MTIQVKWDMASEDESRGRIWLSLCDQTWRHLMTRKSSVLWCSRYWNAVARTAILCTPNWLADTNPRLAQIVAQFVAERMSKRTRRERMSQRRVSQLDRKGVIGINHKSSYLWRDADSVFDNVIRANEDQT